MIFSGVDSITLAVNSLCNEHNWGRGGSIWLSNGHENFMSLVIKI